MVISDLHINLNIWLRWLHVLAGIIWIGHLYFFDFVCVPLQRSLDDSEKNAVIQKVMLRALWWFRWGAMISFLSGLFLFGVNYLYTPGVGFEANQLLVDDHGITGRATWILFGMTVASVMWFNVWFVIWPAQKKLVLAGDASADHGPFLFRRSFLAVRTNTLLSGPMLFAMLAPSHYGAISFLTWLLVLATGILVMWCLIRFSRVVGTSRGQLNDGGEGDV
jgi:uncharacterized membrane protein